LTPPFQEAWTQMFDHISIPKQPVTPPKTKKPKHEAAASIEKAKIQKQQAA